MGFKWAKTLWVCYLSGRESGTFKLGRQNVDKPTGGKQSLGRASICEIPGVVREESASRALFRRTNTKK